MTTQSTISSADVEQQAIGRAAAAFAQLRGSNDLLQECINNATNVSELVESIERRHKQLEKKPSSKLLALLQKHTTWLDSLSGLIDGAVKARADLLCPASNFHAQVAQQITAMIEIITESLPRLDLYKKLQSDKGLQIALLNIFTDIVEFCAATYKYFKHRTLVRIGKLILTPLKTEFEKMCKRLKWHTKNVDDTAVAVELLRAAEFRAKMQAQNAENMKSKCDSWLNPANMLGVHQARSRMRVAGTCEWLLSSQDYDSWLRTESDLAEDRLLGVLGKGGCGKSILSSYIVDNVQEEHGITIYFSFSGADAPRQTLQSLVRSLVSQLVHKPDYIGGYELVHELTMQEGYSMDGLWTLLYKILALGTNRLFLVVDGVDECSEPAEQLVEHVMGILNTIRSSKIVLLGRAHVSELRSHSSYIIEMDPPLIKLDLQSFITTQLRSNTRLYSLGIQDSISQTLLERSDGMFLWVKLMIDDLSRASSVSEVTQKLECLPRGLHAAYHQIIQHLVQTLDDFEIRLAQNILGFVAAAGRTLEVEELHCLQALSSRATAGDYSSGSIRNHVFIDPIEKFSRVCGGLIHILDGKVTLVHITAKEFLQRPVNKWETENHPQALNFRVDLVRSHEFLSTACLDFLLLDGAGISHTDAPQGSTTKNLRLFFKYAARFFVYHIKNSGPISERRLERIRQLVNSGGMVSLYEHYFVLLLEDGYYEDLDDEFSNFFEWAETQNLELGPQKSFFAVAHEECIQRFGAEDWRTKELVTLVTGELPPTEHPQVDPVDKVGSKEAAERLSALMNLLKENQQMQTLTKIDLLLNMRSLIRIKALSDPLEALFLLIMRQAHRLPAVFLMLVGGFYLDFKKPRQALAAYEAALENVEHLDTALKFEISDIIGKIYSRHLVDYAKAEAAYRKSASGRREMLGPDHEKTLHSLDWLANALYEQKDYAPAVEIWMEVYEKKMESLLGDTSSERRLGNACFDQNQLYDRLRHLRLMREKLLGKETYSIIGVSGSLACALHAQGHFGLAKVLWAFDIEAWKRLRGEDHADTLITMKNLSTVLTNLDPLEAENIYRQVYTSQSNTLGEDHPETLQSLLALSDAQYRQKNYVAAEESLRAVISINEEIQGDKCTGSLDPVESLACTLFFLDRFEEAEVLDRRLLAKRERELGAKDPKTLRTVAHLGQTLRSKGDCEMALKLGREALQDQEDGLGKEHPDTLESMYQVAYSYLMLEQVEEAKQVCFNALERQVRILGTEHIVTRGTIVLLAMIYTESRPDW
ncbi:unnamed protein product [Clonostachys solani]|uniref:NACHT domain-containing protein n=1 Tax=Clonostachys solani TaxID=160281 RepID=A0A9N9W732_9HYPO|nr:unnamed protein product [Clonostachys solani]